MKNLFRKLPINRTANSPTTSFVLLLPKTPFVKVVSAKKRVSKILRSAIIGMAVSGAFFPISAAAQNVSPKFFGLSTRANVGVGENVTIGGINIDGGSENAEKTILIRGVGPQLESLIAGSLADPQIALYSGSTLISSNDNWEDASNVSDVALATSLVGLGAFADGSTDAALLVTLPNGIYTVVLSGVNRSSGVALIEIYEVPAAAGILNLNISGLEDLGSDYNYEGWVIVDGSPVSTGLFNVDAATGNMTQTLFEVDQDDLDRATTFVLTIEPSPDSDPAPSNVHIMAGDFAGSSAVLSIDHGAAIGDDFSTATGGYILATPTNGDNSDENSGVWWLDPAGPSAALSLPTLPIGWKYEGWAVIDGIPVTTGKFTMVNTADEAAPFSGTIASGPPFPGEDFLLNAPSGLTFPTDLSGGTIVISVEPDPDNSPSPFLLKPLVHQVPAGAADHTLFDMNNNSDATNPIGIASR